MKTFGQRIREARHDRGWSLERCATKARMMKSFCCGIETGKLRPPTPAVVARLCKALKLPLDHMLALAWFEKRPKGVSLGALNDILTSALVEVWAAKRGRPKLLRKQGITLLKGGVR